MIFKEKNSQILLVFAIVQVFLSSSCDAVSNDVSQSLGARLYLNLVDANSYKNIFYSPLSVEISLAMLRTGAVGETGREIDTALASSAQGPEQLANEYHDILERYSKSKALSIANKIYVMKGYGVQKTFYNSLNRKFLSSIASVNFAKSVNAAAAINLWVKNQTTITDLISADQLSGQTRFVMVNAMYFKGQWGFKFHPGATYDRLFVLENGKSFNVKMMRTTRKFNNAYVADIQAEVLEMPYTDSNFSMIIVLPGYKQKLSDVEKRFNNISWKEVEGKLHMTELIVNIPKFKVEFETELSKPLSQIGVNRIFSNAEFDKMLVRNKHFVSGLVVDAIVHKAFIEVDEEGTTAGAATGSSATTLTVSTEFTAKKPFYFFIMDKSNNKKIFEGRINAEFNS